MDKNTIWALVLSGIVLFASIFIETNYILPKEQAKAEAQAAAQQKTEQAAPETKTDNSSIIAQPEISTSDATTEAEPVIPETTYTITTNKIQAVFTNKGGDIISYQLLEHKDKQTGNGVEMVNNVTDTNRAFALSFGDARSVVLNDMFDVKQLDDYTHSNQMIMHLSSRSQ